MPKKSKGRKSSAKQQADTVKIHAGSEPVSTLVRSSEETKAPSQPSSVPVATEDKKSSVEAEGEQDHTETELSETEERKKNGVVTGNVSTNPKLKGCVVGPLTSEEQKETRAVKAAYASFWENLKFKKGWDTPLFFQSEIDDLLDQAAEIVGRIRVHLDSVNPGFKVRMVEGNAHEFFWSQHEHPRIHPEAFVRELVHQTLKDANGYVEGLSKEVVDGYVDHILSYVKEEDGSAVLQGEVQLLRAKARRQWKGLSTMWTNAFENAAPIGEASKCTIVQLAAYRELTRALDRVQYYVSIVQEEQNKQRQAQSKNQQATEDAKERFEEQSAKRKQLKAELHSQSSSPAETAFSESSATNDEASQKPDEGSASTESQTIEYDNKQPSSSPSEPLASPTRTPSQGMASPTRTPSQGMASPKRTPSEGGRRRKQVQEEEEDPEDPPAIKRIEELVKEVNVRKTELDRMKDRTQNLDVQELATHPLQSQKTVKSLHERCKYLSLELERDLLKLDAIVGGSKVRPLRKAQVRNIQHMLEDVDSINDKLSGLESSLLPAVEEEQQRLAEQKAKEEAEAAEEKRKEEEKRLEEQRKLEEQEKELEAQREREREQQRVSLNERWKQMKLQPKFDIKELRDGYQIRSYIPGMRKEDLEINHSGNTLTLSGIRVPSQEEETSMNQMLRARGVPVNDQNILRLGAGRFGRFQQQYSLPDDVDTSGLKATYDAGVFQVTIPRRVRSRQMGYPGGGGFFNDRDFWW